MSGASNSIEPTNDGKQFSSFVSTIDLTSEAQSPVKRAARYIRVEDVSAGTVLELEFEDNPGVMRLFTVKVDWEWTGQIVKIGSNTTVSLVSVGW